MNDFYVTEWHYISTESVCGHCDTAVKFKQNGHGHGHGVLRS